MTGTSFFWRQKAGNESNFWTGNKCLLTFFLLLLIYLLYLVASRLFIVFFFYFALFWPTCRQINTWLNWVNIALDGKCYIINPWLEFAVCLPRHFSPNPINAQQFNKNIVEMAKWFHSAVTENNICIWKVASNENYYHNSSPPPYLHFQIKLVFFSNKFYNKKYAKKSCKLVAKTAQRIDGFIFFSCIYETKLTFPPKLSNLHKNSLISMNNFHFIRHCRHF